MDLIRFRTDEKIRLEEERHKNDVAYLEEEHRKQLEIYDKNRETLELELQKIRAEQELIQAQRLLLQESMSAGEVMKEANLTREPFDEERFATILVEKMIEVEEINRKLRT